MEFKSGFATIIGRPNVGKSTMLNQIVGQKIAIMSDKAQTTRNTISGVLTTENEQIIFIDTPGIHKPQHKLGEFMTDIAINTLNQVDVVLFMINASEELGRGDEFIINELQKTKQPVILVLNQIDKISKETLYEKIVEYKDLYQFADIVPISAMKNKNMDTLINVIRNYLEEGPKFYPDGQVTDHPEKFIIAELIREKVLQLTEEEVPHSVAVVIENFERIDDDLIEIMANIIVERAGQKGIIIGKGGKMLKEIGKRARRDIENLLGTKIFLETWVKVEKDWRNKQKYLNEFGYTNNEYK